MRRETEMSQVIDEFANNLVRSGLMTGAEVASFRSDLAEGLRDYCVGRSRCPIGLRVAQNMRIQVFALAISLAVLGCSREPQAPKPTLAGSLPAFDTLLTEADAQWSFVFADDFTVSLTDIFGGKDDVVIDLREWTGKSTSEFLGCESISPDAHFLLTAHYHARTGEENDPDAHLLLLDLQDRSVRDVPVHHEDFQLDWLGTAHWLDEQTFLVPLSKFTKLPDGYSHETVRYLRKQTTDLTADAIVAFPTDHPVQLWYSPSSALLFASEHEPTNSWTVWAIDAAGTRQADPAESDYFNRKHRDNDYDPLCPVSVDTKRVVGDTVVEGWGRYYRENWFRSWILLNGIVVRCSDGEIERLPVWDDDTKLLTWYEIGEPYQVLHMDAQGHYRKWHTGQYWGKIPKRKSS
jgi:hypothetical protein